MKAELDLPAGFRFHPTDDELVKYYLCRKCASEPIAAPVIAEIDLYKFDPWDLPEIASYGEKEWYFFSPRDRKYPNGSRPNRAAGTGYWKATGADKPIGKPKTMGIKKALVFYAGKAPRGIKTNWIMHEYRLANVDRSAATNKKNNSRLDDWVLCRIYNKKGTMEKYYPTEDETTTAARKRSQSQLQSQSPDHESQSHFDTSSSFPTLSSSSGHVLSPEVTCDNREAESEHKWGELNDAFDAFDKSLLDFSSMDWLQNDVFAPQFQYQVDLCSPFQDALMYTEQKPFCNWGLNSYQG